MFISFEGCEGSGKSTQSRLLYRKLLKLDLAAVLTREPGGTVLGARIRNLLKKQVKTPISPRAELMLFVASRAQIVSEVIRPGLEAGAIVICDRFTDSTVAYQGWGRGLDLDEIGTVNRLVTGGLAPDLTILLDISAEDGLGRKDPRVDDRFEQEEVAFHQRVREGYLKLAAAEPRRWLVVDAGLSKEEVSRIIWKRVTEMLALPHHGEGTGAALQ